MLQFTSMRVIGIGKGCGMRPLMLSAIACVAYLCAYGDDVVVDPARSRLWSTVTESSVTVSVPWPAAASTARLVAPASGLFPGVSADLLKGSHSSYELALPRPTDAATEYTVALSLEFSNPQGDVLSPVLRATLGVVCASPRFDGADIQSKTWKELHRRTSVVPVVEGTERLLVGHGGAVVTNAVDVPSAWMMLAHRTVGDHVLSLVDGGDAELESGFFTRLPSGLIMTVR